MCDACGRRGMTHRDHRIPRALGGTDVAGNVHRLCPECHVRKTSIEPALRMGGTSRFGEWWDLAYPRPMPRDAYDYNAEWCETQEGGGR